LEDFFEMLRESLNPDEAPRVDGATVGNSEDNRRLMSAIDRIRG
jgi:hypothetical protein